MNNNFPKFQYSVFVGPSRNEQYVIRTDTLEDLDTAIKDLKLKIGEEIEDVAANATCVVHKVPLQHYEKDGEEWWSHKLPSGSWCNGRKTKYNETI